MAVKQKRIRCTRCGERETVMRGERGPASIYCDLCRDEVKREQNALRAQAYRQRKANYGGGSALNAPPPGRAADFVVVPRVTQEPMEQDEEDRLVALFWEGFGVPDLHSERGNELYYDWVETEEWIAGPIYTVANGGTWDYVFTAQDGSFAAIGDIEALLRWYTTPIERFRKRVEEYHPRSEAGRIDRETLLHKVAILHELGGLGATIHTLRQGVKPSRDTQEDL